MLHVQDLLVFKLWTKKLIKTKESKLNIKNCFEYSTG